MKNFGKLAVLGAALAVSATNAHAVSVNLTVYQGLCTGDTSGCLLNDDGGQSLTDALPTNATTTYTGTVSNVTAADLFSAYLPGPSDVGLSTFLTAGKGEVGSSDGNTVTASTVSSGLNNLSNINNDVFDFTGQTYLAAGNYWFNSDDGMYLCINATTSTCFGSGGGNTMLISSPGSESDTGHEFTITTGEEVYFNLLYTEVNEAPAELEGNLGTLSAIPPPPAPEPSSLMLLGTGLVSAAGLMFRRRQTV